ncbi:MAG: hypothetical protein SPH93_12445 [Clostridium sp.]|uniref:hypothetical protein n=1 Tax=Clostridium sp. TaxID=1506 RepID=UPI002A909D86|nr:hypothetical protein [Clostridium sp.]MDY6228447.1 hypothetical protein [Clostridium sp.]
MKFKKIIACAILITFTSSVTTYANAAEIERNNNLENRIEEVTGIEDISTNLSYSDKYIAIADGTNTTVEIPKDATDKITLDAAYDEDEDISIKLPNEAVGSDANITKNGTVIYKNEEQPVSFAVQPINNNSFEGVRTLINIKNNTAPKEYSFTFDLDEGSKLISDSEYLGEEFSSGEIFIVNSENIIVGIIDKPWAYDANGEAVETYYRIDNTNTLTQVVNFTNDNAFPIVADPSAWQVTKCAAAITWVIGSTVFAAAKILRIKKYIAALGGIKSAATLLMGATTAAERLEIGGSALMNLASEILGIAAVQDNCFP